MIMSRILLDSSERSEKIDGNDCIRRVETTACPSGATVLLRAQRLGGGIGSTEIYKYEKWFLAQMFAEINGIDFLST